MNKFDFIICGNSLAGMVGALQLSKSHRVAIITSGEAWGGHFAGIVVNGLKFDIGMNLLEFKANYSESSNLRTYDPEVRNDSARFLGHVQELVTLRCKTRLRKGLKTLVQGQLLPDFIISNDLSGLHKLPATLRQEIQNEISIILQSPRSSYHAANKRENQQLFREISLEQASLANHGKTFHNSFIQPLCNKILNASSSLIPALYHRIPWCPLYYPETLSLALQDKSVALATCEFHYPEEEHFSRITEKLYSEIATVKNITIINQAIEDLCLAENQILTSIGQLQFRKLIWATDLQVLQKLVAPLTFYELTKSPITLGFLQVDKEMLCDQFASIFIPAGETDVYRITNQSSDSSLIGLSKLVIELKTKSAQETGTVTGDQQKSHILSFLYEAKVLTEGSIPPVFELRTFQNALVIPSFDNLQKIIQLRQDLNLLAPDIELIGPAAPYGATSFNCQVVQGLVLGEKYR